MKKVANFEKLRETITNNFGKLEKKTEPKDDIRKQKKYHILNEIVLSGYEGISHTELAKKIGINPKNLRKYVRELIDDGLVKRGIGKHGRYFATGNVYPYIHASSSLFGTLIRDILQKNLIVEDCYGIDNNIYSENIQLKLDKYPHLVKMLFEFSSKIGAIITYTIIQSMVSSNRDFVIPTNIDIPKNTRRYFTDYKTVGFYQDWVQEALEYAFNNLVWEFMNTILLAAQELEGSRYAGLYIDGLVDVLAQMYPKVHNEIHTITSDFPKAVQSHKEHQKFLAKREEIQRKCKHELTPFLGQLVRNIIPAQQHCFRCHKNISNL